MWLTVEEAEAKIERILTNRFWVEYWQDPMITSLEKALFPESDRQWTFAQRFVQRCKKYGDRFGGARVTIDGVVDICVPNHELAKAIAKGVYKEMYEVAMRREEIDRASGVRVLG